MKLPLRLGFAIAVAVIGGAVGAETEGREVYEGSGENDICVDKLEAWLSPEASSKYSRM